MRVYLDVPHESIALARIRQAVAYYAPDSVEIVEDERSAEVVVLTVIGRFQQTTRRVRSMCARGQRYAVIQVCLESTMVPDPRDWLQLWRGALVVWSTYNLEAMIGRIPGFYHAPFGADADAFRLPVNGGDSRLYLMMASGPSWLTESVREVVLACRSVGGRPVVLGPGGAGRDVDTMTGLSDAQLADLYRQCWYVSGLRRTEGFELGAAEGILCGARPVLFDRPHYREWYDGLGVFIRERSRPEVIADVRAMLACGLRPVTETTRADAAQRFDWARLAGGFWERCLDAA